ncbi:MAG: M18 family aminopeptidase [Clostridia bacterium]|nr:M18 family aminopeptidase [Clostridia bacterium]
MNEYTKKLLSFIEASPSPYHVCENFAQMLLCAGFTELSEGDVISALPQGGYFVRRNASSILAFRMPKEKADRFMICAAHSDSPTFCIKEDAELVSGPYVRINAERYGGMIPQAWMDRPLSVAGRLLVREADARITTKLVNVDRDLLLIPNIAPHMTRINETNPAIDLVPLFGEASAKGSFRQTVAEAAGVEKERILSADLYLYNRDRGTVWGADDAFVSAPRLDDLQCAFSAMTALLSSEPMEHTVSMCAVFDNEEVGSHTKQGAASSFLSDILHRILFVQGRTEQDYMTAIANSMMVSADNAHAVHPNHPEFADPTHRPQMNGGIVIKHNASQRYTTDAVSAALFLEICRRADVRVQHFYNRSDMTGGSTLGNIANMHVSLNTVDIGMAQLAMHSPLETAGARDTEQLICALRVFFGARLHTSAGGTFALAFS